MAIENWAHDFNIGSVVRTANAFGARGVHIVGRRRWNRRGAMVTDRYQHVAHHPTVEDLVTWARDAGLAIIGVDNLPGSVPLETFTLPRACVLVFGQESVGLSPEVREAADATLAIAQDATVAADQAYADMDEVRAEAVARAAELNGLTVALEEERQAGLAAERAAANAPAGIPVGNPVGGDSDGGSSAGDSSGSSSGGTTLSLGESSSIAAATRSESSGTADGDGGSIVIAGSCSVGSSWGPVTPSSRN